MIRTGGSSSSPSAKLARRRVGSPGTVPRDGGSLKGKWKSGGAGTTRRELKRCGAVGIWAMSNFRHELLAQMDGKIGRHHGGPERRESAEQRAEKILSEELKRRGWDRKELKRRRKADLGKVRLRKETTMNWRWIAASLAMGAADYAAACVRELLKQ